MPSARSREDPFRIAVVGGGIGGLFTALALHHHIRKPPIQIDVYEQAAQYREIGAGVGFGPNASRLFHELGIGDQLNAIAGQRSGVWISFRRFDTGEEVITVPSQENEKGKNTPVSRSELLDFLVATIRTRNAATLHNDKCCSSVEEVGDTVKIHFKDNTSALADFVIGCDGIHSAIRSQFATDKPVYGGMIAYRGVIPISTLPTWNFPSYAVTWIAKGRHFLVFPICVNKSLNIVAFVTKAESEVEDTRESWTATCSRSDVEKDFAGFEETVQHIIRQMPDPSSKWRLNYREPLDQWVHLNGKVVLVGDAAHSMMPHQGAGAGQAIEDAWILAQCLSAYLDSSNADESKGDMQRWMQLYQSVRLPRAQKVAITSKEAGETYEMVTDDLNDKPLEECLPIVADRLRERMKWVWSEDLSSVFDKAKKEAGLA
jgi:salicylate hydroxylase